MKNIFRSLVASSLFFLPLCEASNESSTVSASSTVEFDFTEHFTCTQAVVAEHSHENQDVLQAYNNFLTHLYSSYYTGEGMITQDLIRILEGIKFAACKHHGQTRKDAQATPYIIHPIGVADHLLTVGCVHDPDILIAALLHDTVEDTSASFEEIRSIFGERVEGFVREVSDDRTLSTAERKALQIAHAPCKSAGAAQIKLADKFYNLNDLLHAPPPDWDKERIDAYFSWAAEVVHALPWVNAKLLHAVDQLIADYYKQPVPNLF